MQKCELCTKNGAGEPLCVKGCITGALTRQNGMIVIDENKCVGCFTCILSCPYGAIEPDETGHVMQKCELCKT